MKPIKDTREHWFGSDIVELSVVGGAVPRTTVPISYVVKVGDFQHVDEHLKRSLISCSRPISSPGKKEVSHS